MTGSQEQLWLLSPSLDSVCGESPTACGLAAQQVSTVTGGRENGERIGVACASFRFSKHGVGIFEFLPINKGFCGVGECFVPIVLKRTLF